MRISIALAAALLSSVLPASCYAQGSVLTIGEIQGKVTDADNGATHRSPLAPPSGNGSSSALYETRGVVRQKVMSRTSSGATNRGFFLQSTEASADGDPETSDGIFVFMSTFTSLIGGYVPQVGDEIVVRARVSEFFNLTQLTGASLVTLVQSGVDVDAAAPSIDAEPPSVLADANRWWERREGMSVRVPAGYLATSPRDVFASTADGEAWVMSDELRLADRRDPFARRAFRDPHPLDDLNPPLFDNGNGYRILLGSLGVKFTANDSTELIAPVRTFDRLRNDLAGGVYFSFNKYSVQVAQQPVLRHGVDPSRNAPPRRPDRDDEYSIANYNVENLYDFRDDPTDGCDFVGNTGCPGVSPPFDFVPASDAEYRAKLAEQAEQIDDDLHRPDILLVQEAEDQDICSVENGALACGPDRGDGSADTLQELALEIEDRSGARYAAALDRDGADDRGIVSGFLYRTDRVRLAEPRAGDPVLGSSPAVEYRAPGLIYNTDVQNPKVLNAELPADVDRSTGVDGTDVYTRPPQVARFRIWRDRVGRGRSVELVVFSNHFSSTPNGRVGQRTEQSRYGAALVEAASGESPQARDARVLFGGDLNVFPRPDDPFAPGDPLFPSDQLGPLYDEAGLENLWDELRRQVPESAYTYVFEGQAQTLDHQFVSRQLERDLERVRVAHINADWPADFDGDRARGASDHDPVVSRFEFPGGRGRDDD
jgi:predicted extracellular nuclease